jgi:hypothetical protein
MSRASGSPSFTTPGGPARTPTATRWWGVDVLAKRYVDYVAKLQETDRVVVQRDKGQGSLERDGYIGVFSFKDLKVDPAGPIEMRLTSRLASALK